MISQWFTRKTCQFPLLRQNEHFQQWKFSRPIYVLGLQTKTCKSCRWRIPINTDEVIGYFALKTGDCSHADRWRKFAEHKWTASLQFTPCVTACYGLVFQQAVREHFTVCVQPLFCVFVFYKITYRSVESLEWRCIKGNWGKFMPKIVKIESS